MKISMKTYKSEMNEKKTRCSAQNSACKVLRSWKIFISIFRANISQIIDQKQVSFLFCFHIYLSIYLWPYSPCGL
jgi:hypothetical protein